MSCLEHMLRLIDTSVCNYNVGHVKQCLPADSFVDYFDGTTLPCAIKLAKPFEFDTVIYEQEWHCCGKYQCTTGNGKDSARRFCGAVAVLTITALAGSCDNFTVAFNEPPSIDHGDEFCPPSEPRNCSLYQTKPIIVQAAICGDSFSELLAKIDFKWRPKSVKEVKAFRRRFENQQKKKRKPIDKSIAMAKQSKKKNSFEIHAALALTELFFSH